MSRRPGAFHEFVGQRKAIGQLKALVAGAKARAIAVPSLLLVGPPGTGKSALAGAIAREVMQVPDASCAQVMKRLIGGPRMAVPILELLQSVVHADVVFLDEAHALDEESQELLYVALDERKIFGVENGRVKRDTLTSIAEFTLICATTEPGSLKYALRSRLIRLVLEPYSLKELRYIAQRVATEHEIVMTAQAARHLAERSQRTPRSIENLIAHLTLTTIAQHVTLEDVRSFLHEQGVDERGLDSLQRQLVKIVSQVSGHATSMAVISSRLGIDERYVRTELEPRLLEEGLIEIGQGGRRLTTLGREFASTLTTDEITDDLDDELADVSDERDQEPV